MPASRKIPCCSGCSLSFIGPNHLLYKVSPGALQYRQIATSTRVGVRGLKFRFHLRAPMTIFPRKLGPKDHWSDFFISFFETKFEYDEAFSNFYGFQMDHTASSELPKKREQKDCFIKFVENANPSWIYLLIHIKHVHDCTSRKTYPAQKSKNSNL